MTPKQKLGNKVIFALMIRVTNGRRYSYSKIAFCSNAVASSLKIPTLNLFYLANKDKSRRSKVYSQQNNYKKVSFISTLGFPVGKILSKRSSAGFLMRKDKVFSFPNP